MTLIHATAVADPASGRAVLLRGPPGSGKSDLALRLIDRGWRLVADDQVAIEARAGRLIAGPPAAIVGRIEARGLGIIALPHMDEAMVVLVIDLVARDGIERLPEPERCALSGVDLPLLRLAPFEASAVAKVRLAAEAAGGG
ncbi:MAG: serine/threonine protein kinase [Alphaproteobacteria bacterium]|nr:serine/threonine protein kinase [Alphaproteobacteria bacterium]